MSWFDGKLDRNNPFIAALIAQVVKSVEVLRQLELHLHDINTELIDSLRAHASAAAELRRVLIDDLHRTFITPLDREDIFNLSHCNSDVVSYALSSAEEMFILDVPSDAAICSMVALIRQEAQELELALMRLPDNPRVAGDHATEVRRLEHEVEKVYRQAVKDLFAQSTDVAKLPQIFYRREVYRHLSNMSDRADAAAHVIGMVVMKLA